MELQIGKHQKRRFGGGYNPFDPVLQGLLLEQQDENRILKRAMVAAVIAHILLLLVVVPRRDKEPMNIRQGSKVFVVQQVRFKKPPPPKAEREIPKPKTKKIPIPDPTPDEPEPIRELIDEISLELDVPQVDDLFGVPDGPPGPGSEFGGPLEVGGNVTPPEKIFAPQPLYSEDARQGRVEGVVILQTIVDIAGNIENVKVLKGLPMGLTDSAVETVKTWRFRPAMMDGNPVPVYFMLSVSFRIQ